MSNVDSISPPSNALRPWIRCLLIVTIATVLGPLIGGATVFVLYSVPGLIQSWANVYGLADLLIIVLGVAYMIGGIVAFVAGVLLAAISLRRQLNFMIVMAAVVVANIGYAAVTEPRALYSAAADLERQEFLISLGFSLYAATICWLLFRRLLRNPQITTDPS